jgi:hypothetical protein
VFEAVGGLPHATRFEVEVPAGVRDATGAVLEQPYRWNFTTSAPGVRNVLAIDVPSPAQPVIAVVFDQRVAADLVAPLLRLTVSGRDVPLRPVRRQAVEPAGCRATAGA